MNLCIIPARGGSKRIPRKNITLFAGKPMIAWSIEAALQSGCFDQVIVSTDDQEIAEVATRYGASVPFLRPPELSTDHTATRPVVQHALQYVLDHSEQAQQPAHVCCLYATAPLVTAEDIKAGYDTLIQSDCAFAFTVVSFPHPVERALRITGTQRVQMRDQECRKTRSQDLETLYHDAGQFYWGTRDAFLTNETVFEGNAAPIIVPRYRAQDIDTAEDLVVAELLFRALQEKSAAG